VIYLILPGAILLSACSQFSGADLISSNFNNCEVVDLSEIEKNPIRFSGVHVCFRSIVHFDNRSVYLYTNPGYDGVRIYTDIPVGWMIRSGFSSGQVLDVEGIVSPVSQCFEVRPDSSLGCEPVRFPVNLQRTSMREPRGL